MVKSKTDGEEWPLIAALDNRELGTLDESEIAGTDKIGETVEATFNEFSKAEDKMDTVGRRSAVGVKVVPCCTVNVGELRKREVGEPLPVGWVCVTLTPDNAMEDAGRDDKLGSDRGEDSGGMVPTTEDPGLGSREIKGAEGLDTIDNTEAETI